MLPLPGMTAAEQPPPAIPEQSLTSPPVPTPEQIEHFESKIRPLLHTHCSACHGSKKQEYGLRLDKKQGFMAGGDDGPIFDPAQPANSKILAVIRHEGEIKMPPEAKLPDTDLQLLRSWIEQGAPWPEEPEAQAKSTPAELGKNHWAFQKVTMPAVPRHNPEELAAGGIPADWVKSPIDEFILAKLRDKNLTPAPPADPRSLIRRVYYDLTGLPPTATEVDEFCKNPTPQAYAEVVERLLASPHYGERWARYWLDLSRYADTKGYVFTEDRAYPFAYVYRDWVVNALNNDLPYDQFLIKQLAADLLPLQSDQPRPDLAALGFLTLGRRFLNNKFDIIDDRIDVLMRTTQGLTVSCARCHDHKFDPIPTADYYSLFGIFDACVEELVPISPPSPAYQDRLAAVEKKLTDYRAEQETALRQSWRDHLAEYLLVAKLGNSNDQHPQLSQELGKLQFSKPIIERWKKLLEQAGKDHSPIWSPYLELVQLTEADFAAQAGPIWEKYRPTAEKPAKINPRVAQLFTEAPSANLRQFTIAFARLLTAAEREFNERTAAAQAANLPVPTALDDPAAEELRQIIAGENSPFHIRPEQLDRAFSKPVKDELKKLRDEVGQLAKSPEAPAQALILRDAPQIAETTPILLRGNPDRAGPHVPRRFVSIITGPERPSYKNGSGRLELAREIASADNPLTARVIVNRVWQHHFGTGLVPTASDFGVRTVSPPQRELLDFLAADFIQHGWSLKHLHRQIVLSSVYQQSSADRPAARSIDPENDYYWRANRRRLDLEALRDSLLAASGKLDLTLGGKAVEMVEQHSNRRSIYGHIERQNLPGFFRTFDFASPDTHTPQRFNTTVPQQALFFLNSPFVVEMAEGVLERQSVAKADNPAAKIQALYQCVLGRSATPEEESLALKFVEKPTPADGVATSPAEHAWRQLAQALLMTNEFVFVD
ncbi:MAG: PSD1 and planctomycete cytochrome C domain-containing protein [Pirellulales bacterium]|nr:PSD1 and planctomycete cytochrome C domain-containing protein [Pirellulales bacterium]